MPRPPAPRRPSLRDVLLARLGNPDRHRLKRLANGVRKRFGPMSRLDCYAVLANEQGISLHKYLSELDLSRVRGIIAAGPAQPVTALGADGGRRRAKVPTSLKEIVIDGAAGLVMDDPILPSGIVDDARRMARVYPLTYVFENSVREMVVRVMHRRHGVDWWKSPMVPLKVLRNVETNKKNEASVPWHGQRGSHAIHYTSIDDLIAIITINENWPAFKPILEDQNAVQFLIQVIELSRHTIAHHRPLSADDVTALKVNIRAWQKMLRERQHLI